MNIDRQISFDKLFPLDSSSGPVRFTPDKARAIVENALDQWQADRPKVVYGRWRKALLLAAATFAIASAAAGLFYVGYADTNHPSAGLSNLSQQSTQKAIPTRAVVTEVSEAADNQPPAPSSTLSEGAPRATKPRDRQQPAADLLLLANKLRQQAKWSAAEQTYRRVCIVYPNSPSAYVASIAAASIRLEQLSNPNGALALYNQAISANPNGPLDIEARLGVARSWQQLGEREREIKALKSLLQKHSSGPIVQRARERLDAISREN